MDPTIPRHDRRGVRGPTYGWFVDYGDRVLLTDRRGNTWSAEYVQIVQGSFGFADEGLEKMPRPRKYDATGNVVILGDQVLIDFLDGDPRLPIVRGGVRAINHSDFFQTRYAEGKGWDRLRFRVRPLTSTGAEAGRVDVRIADDGKGSAVVSGTESVEVLVGVDPDDPNKPFVRLTLDGSTVVVDRGGAVERVVLGDSFIGDLNGAWAALVTFLTTTSTATTAATIAGAALLAIDPAGAVAKLAANLLASAAAQAPYLSKVSKTE